MSATKANTETADRHRLLIVDDDRNWTDALRLILLDKYQVEVVNSAADALEKIEFAAAPTISIKQGSAHLCIADPLGRAVTGREGYWADLLATHPPMVKRISALREMAYQASGLRVQASGRAEI